MEVPVINKDGQDTGRTVQLADEVFGIEPREHVMYLDVKQYLANQRQGTHKSKERAEVAGSTRKIKKQKGTGGARAGSLKSPVFVGGGTIFGPRPRDYGFKVNLKTKVLARKSALALKVRDQNLKVVEDFNFDKPSTKAYGQFLKQLSLTGKTLLILPETNKNVYLSGRNLPKTKITTVDQLNTYDLLHTDTILLSENSVARVTELLNK